jgi:hypothetical protein
MALHLGLARPITDFCVDEHRADGTADQGELLIGIAAAIVRTTPLSE